MRRIKRFCLHCAGAVFAALPAHAAAFGADGGVVVISDFYYGGAKIADTTVSLRIAGDSYTIKSHSAAVGLAKVLHGDVVAESAGQTDAAHGLLMTAYFEKRGFRPEQGTARDGDMWRFWRGDETRAEAAGAAPLFDYLTAAYRSYALGAPAGGTLIVTKGWKQREYVYEIGGEEMVQTGMGEVRAVVLMRRSGRGERKVWLAAEYGWLPVRFYVDDKGHVFETVAREIITGL